MDEKDIKYYGTSTNKNFKVVDSIGVPHLYCITPKHLCGGGMYLGETEIIEAEKQGATCGICKGKLSYKEHERALLIGCKSDINKELHSYLLKIKDKAKKKGFSGFAFKEGF